MTADVAQHNLLAGSCDSHESRLQHEYPCDRCGATGGPVYPFGDSIYPGSPFYCLICADHLYDESESSDSHDESDGAL